MLLSTKIFPPRGFSAAQMAFRLVFIQNFLDFLVKPEIQTFELLGEIFMYRAFADPEVLSGGSDGRPVFQNVSRDLLAPLTINLLHVRFSFPFRDPLCRRSLFGYYTI